MIYGIKECGNNPLMKKGDIYEENDELVSNKQKLPHLRVHSEMYL